MKTIIKFIYPTFATPALVCVALCTTARAVSPSPDGGYAGNNTAEGQNALLSLNVTTGTNNTAVGWFSLKSNVEGQYNTALGAGTLFNNTADRNTAIGGAAMFSNTDGTLNTAVGMLTLFNCTAGNRNTAIGDSALFSNIGGDHNTAVGMSALLNNTAGNRNTAIGENALFTNTSNFNTAIGYGALFSNTSGYFNTAVGVEALHSNRSGAHNTALGDAAGQLLTGSGNLCIGSGVLGVAGESNTTRIRNVYDSVATARAVYVDSANKIGTLFSTRRVKDDIKPMDKASDAIFFLKPVTFRYKQELDPTHTLQFGLIAEEVADVNTDLVTRDTDGKPETVRYESINAMLLNEFLKEHRKVQEQGAAIAHQQKQIEALTAGLQKVSAQLAAASPSGGGLEGSKSSPQLVNNP